MRAYEILEYQTKSGIEIDIKYNEDVEGDNNRGWTIHKLDAYVKGDYAGYIKLSYIPRERFEKYYPTVLNYMSQIGGTSVMPYEKRAMHYNDLNDGELKDAVQRLAHHTHKYYELWNTGEDIPETRKELIFIMEDIIKNDRKLQEKQKEFEEFEEHHVDKPVVDYIRVFEEGESRFDRSTGIERDKSTQNYQRQRIGTALYLEAAEYLKGKGMNLYASSLQQPEAEAAWAKFEKEGRVKSDGNRRWLEI